MSCSYGPGRYDSSYEESGHDYPLGFVRWTEQRNFQAVLQAMSEGWLDISALITNKFSIDQSDQAYEALLQDKSALGILLTYPKVSLPDANDQRAMRSVAFDHVAKSTLSTSVTATKVSVIGAGNYASRMLIPAFKNAGVRFDTIYANTGLNCQTVAKKYHFSKASTELDQLWNSSGTTAVVIVTRHNSHADLVCKALQSDKHVFVEKPLALTLDDIEEIENVYHDKSGRYKVMVGFNRRFFTFHSKDEAAASC